MARESLEVLRMRGAKTQFEQARKENEQRASDWGGKFRSAAEAAPFTLRSLGLGNGMATLAAKEGETRAFAAMLARWLLCDCPHSPYRNGKPKLVVDAENARGKDGEKRAAIAAAWVLALLDKIAAGDRAAYRAGQIEAVAFASWLKRLAQAFCVEEEA